MSRPALSLLFVCGVAAGCEMPVPEGRFVCATSAECPEGWVCRPSDRRCWSTPDDGGAAHEDAGPRGDGGPPDAEAVADGGLDPGPDAAVVDAGRCDVVGAPCTDCSIRSVGNNCCSGACLCSGAAGMCGP